MSLHELSSLAKSLPDTPKMPVMFVGHGNPMNAIDENSITKGWARAASKLSPTAILCISAHWETAGTFVTSNPRPRTIHDFYGFPKELFEVNYPSPGAPQYAQFVKEKVDYTPVELSDKWGLDHGTWSVLVKMFPKADVPVFQLSLDQRKGPNFHYQLGKSLAFLRQKGVLIVGSGNIVHNLRMANFRATQPYDWALEFDQLSKKLIVEKDHRQLIDYPKLGQSALLSIPTPEHYLPMLYILGLQEKDEKVTFFNEQIDFGSGSMRSFVID